MYYSKFSEFKDCGKTYFKMYIKTKQFFQNIYEVYKQVVCPRKAFYEFVVKKIYLITRKDYEIKKVDVTNRFALNPTKLYHSFDVKKNFDANPERDYLEMECIFNGQNCRFISSESSDDKLNIPLNRYFGGIRDANSILYAELYDHYHHEKDDVTERVREYYRGTEILDFVLNDYDNDKELGLEDGFVTINDPLVLEKLFVIPRRNSHHSLKIMKL